MTTFNRLYLSETINYYGINWQVGPGVLVSNNKQYGWLINAVFSPVSFPQFQFTSNNQRIYNSEASTNLSGGPVTISASSYSPVAQSSMQSTNSANWQLNEKTLASLSGTYNKSPGIGGLVQYGLTLSRTLFDSPLLNLTLSSSVIKSNNQPTILSFQLNSSFSTVYDINVGARRRI